MAGLLSIQLGNATNGQTEPMGSSTDGAEVVTGFAALLSGICNLANGPKTPAVALGLANPGVQDLADGLEQAAGMASAQLRPLNPERGPEAPAAAEVKPSEPATIDLGNAPKVALSSEVKSSRFELSWHIPPAALTLAGVKASTVSLVALSDGATEGATGTPQLPSRAVVSPGNGGGLDPDPVVLDAKVQTQPENVSSLTDFLSEAALGIQFGNTTNEGPHGEPSVGPVSAAVSGKDPDKGGGSHIRLHRRSGELLFPADQAPVRQAASTDALTSVAAVSQPPVGTVGLPILVPTSPPSSDAAVAVAVRSDGDHKTAGLHRPGSEPAKGPTAGADLPAERTPPPALTASEIEPEKLAVKSDLVQEASAPSVRVELPAASPSVSAPTRADRPPPAAPADQIAPALVGILQKTDGQQSVTVRLQPAELGQVQIRVDQTVAGAAHIAITAERPETLQLLQREEPRLQQVLDQAGVLSSGRTVSFQVATADQIGASASRPDSMETGAGASGQGQSGGMWRQNGDLQNDFGRGPGTDQGQNRPRWFRAGLDITA